MAANKDQIVQDLGGHLTAFMLCTSTMGNGLVLLLLLLFN